MANPYDTGLDRNPANYQPLTPLVFLQRAASVHPHHTAVIHGKTRIPYAEFYARSRKLASALAARGIGVAEHGVGDRTQRSGCAAEGGSGFGP